MEENKKKQKDKKWIVIFAVAIIIMFVLPWVFEYKVFRSKLYSPVSNDGWASFLGSYVGGAMGGIGTLIAVVITTKKTREIQNENAQQIEGDRKEREKKEKKEFMNSIVEDVSKFVADTTIFADKNRIYHEELRKKNFFENDLQKTIRAINENAKRYSDNDDVVSMDAAITNSKLEQKKQELLRNIMECKSKMEISYVDLSRSVAIERHTALSIKLHGIEGSDSMIEKMDEISEKAMDTKNTFREVAHLESELLRMTVDLREKILGD